MLSSLRQAIAAIKFFGASPMTRSVIQLWTIAWRFSSGKESSRSSCELIVLS